jgi:hypothetical protein
VNPSPPTRLWLADLRADALHRLLRSPRGRVETVEEIPSLSELFTWPRRQIELAIDQLVSDGRIVEDARGRLVVRKALRLPGHAG